jgi:glycosyltransferase involved in cell wall biosynthesis
MGGAVTPRLSVIVPTTGRASLARALQSLADQPLAPEDEVLVVGEGDPVAATVARFGYTWIACPPGHNFGCDERTLGIARATGTHLVFLDDDDAFLPGAFAAIRAAVAAAPGRPVMFRMIAPGGRVLWTDPVVRIGNHGTPQFVPPNDPARLGQWGTRYEGDFDFCVSTLAHYPADALVWDPTVIYTCRPTVAAVGGLVLLVHPGASVAPADVEAGLRFGLEAHGVRVIRYRLDERIEGSRRWLYTAWRRVKRARPDFERPTASDVFYHAGIGVLEMALRHQVEAVVVVSAMYLHPDVVVLLKRAGVRVVVLFTETPYDLEHELRIAALVDGGWTHERSAVDAFRAVNPRMGYLAHGWHPERHRPGPRPGDDAVAAHDVVFVGSGNRERVEWLTAIDWTGIDLGLYGSWDLLGSRSPLRAFVRGGPTHNAVAASLYRRAQVGLNLYRVSKGWGRNAPPIAHAESLNPRAYELAACGVFHVSTARAEVGEVFGDLVPTFTTPDEASAVIRAWLASPVERARIAAALPARVAAASWVTRSATVIGDLQQLLALAAVHTH